MKTPNPPDWPLLLGKRLLLMNTLYVARNEWTLLDISPNGKVGKFQNELADNCHFWTDLKDVVVLDVLSLAKSARAKSSPVTVADLKDQTSTPYPRSILFCRACGNTCSANKGDYLACGRDPAYVFNCCEQPMELVIKRVTFEPVKI